MRRLLVCLLGCLVSGCSKSSMAPPAPAPTPVVQSVSIAGGDDWIFMGQPEQWRATAFLSDGSQQNVVGGASWRTSNTAASVSDLGLVVGLISAPVTITASWGGVQSSKAVRVIPTYQGTWVGNYVVTSCAENGVLAGTCASTFKVGSPHSFVLTLTQIADQVSGRTSVGAFISNSFTIAVSQEGAISFVTSATVSPFTISESWGLNSLDDGSAGGGFNQVITSSQGGGSALVQSTISDARRQ